MLKSFRWFVDRLVERVLPLVATSFSSSVQTMHALTQAEQQRELEEAARRYEADGLPHIAATLRERGAGLTSVNPVAESLTLIENMQAGEPDTTGTPDKAPGKDGFHLPDLSGGPGKPKRQRRGRKAAPNSEDGSSPANGS